MSYLASLNHTAEKILTLVATHTDYFALPNEIATALGESFQVDACMVIVAPKNPTAYSVTGWWQSPHGVLDCSQFPLDSCWQQLSSPDGKQTLVENQLQDVCNDAVSSLAINFGGNPNAIVVLIKAGSNVWRDSEKQELKSIEREIAIAASQIALQHQVGIQGNFQSLVNRFSQKAASSDLKSLYGWALSEVGKTLKLQKGKIVTLKYKDPYFIQRKRQQKIKATLTVAESWTAEEQNLLMPQGFSFELAHSDLFQQALDLAPEPLTVDQSICFPDLAAEFLPSGVAVDASKVLLMPLMGKKTGNGPALVLGFLVLQRDSLSSWSEQEIDLANWVSTQLSTALIHHQTLTQVNSMVEERTSQLQWSVDVQAKLSEKMRQQIEQLKSLNELKDDFLSSMSHELKTPMTSMKMAIKMLRQEIPDSMREKYLDILEQEWNREYNLIKDLLKLQQVESGELNFVPQELQLDSIIKELGRSFEEKWQGEKGLNLDLELVESDLSLNSDLDSLNNIISELLLNAAKYSDADSTITVVAKDRPSFQGKELQFAVSNYGVPIEANEIPYIFDKFRRGKGVTDRAVPGTGLGLTLVRHLVEHLNGSIDVTSEADASSELYKTTFTVTLPQK